MNIDECRVLPNYQTVSIKNSDLSQAKGLNGCLGCLMWGGIWLACWFVAAMVGQLILGTSQEATAIVMVGSFIFGIVVPTVCVVALALVVKRNNIERLKIELTEQARARELQRVNSLTYEAKNRYRSAIGLARDLRRSLESATQWLTRAENEYRGNAFGPFWDAVENAAVQLSTFNNHAKALSNDAEKYYLALKDETHNFPSFPVQNAQIPDPSTVVSELSKVVRMGQTNFEFANIWEHRRTRDAIISGFRTLGEAVSNVGSVTLNAVSGLRWSVSSDVARVVEQQIKSQASLDNRLVEQNRILDKIEHRI